MQLMRATILGACAATVAVAAACGDERSITTEPAGPLGFGISLVKTATNVPRGFVNLPASPIASANPGNDSIIVTLGGLDSLQTGSYVVWVGNDSGTKFARATGNLRITQVDSGLNAAGDPVFTTTVTNRSGLNAFAVGGSNRTLRFATARNAITGLANTDSANLVLVTIEETPGATPGPNRNLWGRRSQAASNVVGLRFGNWKRRLTSTAPGFVPTDETEYIISTSTTAGAANLPIVPRGRVEVRGSILVVNDSNYYRPPVGWYYAAFAVKVDTIGRPVDTVYLGRRTSPYPNRVSLFEADVGNPVPELLLDRDRVLLAMATRVSADSIPKAAPRGGNPAWRDFGFVRVTLQPKAGIEGRMSPAIVTEAVLPKSIRGR
jgi:hypothetical protein